MDFICLHMTIRPDAACTQKIFIRRMHNLCDYVHKIYSQSTAISFCTEKKNLKLRCSGIYGAQTYKRKYADVQPVGIAATTL